MKTLGLLVLTVFIAFPGLNIEVGELRGNHCRRIEITVAGTSYEGIIDSANGFVVFPRSDIDVYEGDAYQGSALSYYGEKDTGVYWIYSDQERRYAFYDIQSGFFSEFLFHHTQDFIFYDENTDYLRVTEDGRRYYYINRRNGLRLSPLYFSSMNLDGMYKGYAVEPLYDSETYVILNDQGQLYRIAPDLTPIDRIIENDILLTKNKEGTVIELTIDDSLDWEDSSL